MKITNRSGDAPQPLGLAGYPDQDPACVRRALDAGVDFYFFYDLGRREFVEALRPAVGQRRDTLVVATGSCARRRDALERELDGILEALGTDYVDLFFLEYVCPADDRESIFAPGGALDAIDRLKGDGLVRLTGASAHDRELAGSLVEDDRVDVLMHRFNMAHRAAAGTVFPRAKQAGVAVVAFTATRWGTLLSGHDAWPHEPPSAADCYRYCLVDPAVEVVLTAPTTMEELDENLGALSGPLDRVEQDRWERYGDLVYGSGTDAFETRWP